MRIPHTHKVEFLVAVFVIGYLLLIAFAPLTATARGLVPCGGAGENPCTPCDLFVLAQNILNFLIRIAAPLAALMLAYGGLLMIIPGIGGKESPAMYTKGKKVLTNAVMGLAIIFFSWIAIDFIIKYVGGRGGEIPKIVGGQIGYGPWNKIECRGAAAALAPSAPAPQPPPREAAKTPAPIPKPPPPPPPGFTPAEPLLAQAILEEKRIAFLTTADCGGNAHARQNIDAVAAGQKPIVCSPTCVCAPGGSSGTVTLSNTMLMALDGMARANQKFIVSSFATGRHSQGSLHYLGKAADLIAVAPSSYSELEGRLKLGGTTFVQCENANGTPTSCSASGVTHIHAEFR